MVYAVLAVTALFGGLDTVDAKVTSFKPGDEFNDGGLSVKVLRATLVSQLTAGERILMTAGSGSQYLAVVAAVKNTSTVDVPLAKELDLRGEPDAKWVDAMRLADGSRTSRIGPGLTDEIAFIWQLPVDALHVGDSVTLRVWKQQYRELSVAYGKGWTDSLTSYGKVVIPVGGRR